MATENETEDKDGKAASPEKQPAAPEAPKADSGKSDSSGGMSADAPQAEKLLPTHYPPAILYARGDALAACRQARAVLGDAAAAEGDKANARLFLETVGTDRMTKMVIGAASAVVFLIVLVLYLFR